MIKQSFNALLFSALLAVSFLVANPAYAADIIIAPTVGLPYGAHEIWSHSEMGQSFVAPASKVKAGFYVEYDAQSAALMPPNAPTTQLVVHLYEGEGLNSGMLLHSALFTVDTATKGFLDVDYAALGVTLVPGATYTLGLSSPDNRGWIVPSVCDFQNVDASGQPTGAYPDGHPFFNGSIVINETGICDNEFHVLETGVPTTVTPPPQIVTPTPTIIISPSLTPKSKSKKVDAKGTITAVGVSSIIVKNVTVYITSATTIKLNYQSSLAVGQKVNYKGLKNADGSVSATFIEVR